jgi:hypothetical protein
MNRYLTCRRQIEAIKSFVFILIYSFSSFRFGFEVDKNKLRVFFPLYITVELNGEMIILNYVMIHMKQVQQILIYMLYQLMIHHGHRYQMLKKNIISMEIINKYLTVYIKTVDRNRIHVFLFVLQRLKNGL